MKENIFKKYIMGKTITHCSVADIGNIVFGLKEKQANENDHRPIEDRETDVLSYSPLRLDEQGGFGQIFWKSGIELVFVAYNSSFEGFIYCDTDFNVFEPKVDPSQFSSIVPNGDRDSYTRGAEHITYIAGDAYIAGFLRKVFKRKGDYQWVDLTDEKNHPYLFSELAQLKKKQGNYAGSRAGFSAIDGFDENDIYAAGDHGDTWHFDGDQWQLVDIPGNFSIKTVTCARDGYVYIAGYTGGIIKGRGDHWENIEPEGGYIFNSSAWFDGKLYLAGDMGGLHVLEGNKIKRYLFPKNGPQQYSFYGGVASSEDALVSYGADQALVFDGEKWEEIIGSPALSGDA